MEPLEIVILCWCLGVGIMDILHRRIPNYLTLGMCVLGVTWLLVTGNAILGANPHNVLLGIVTSIIMTLPAYLVRVLGAADVKLIFAIALIGGLYLTLFSFVIASTITLVFTMVDFSLSKLRYVKSKQSKWFPFGSALSIGLLLGLMVTEL